LFNFLEDLQKKEAEEAKRIKDEQRRKLLRSQSTTGGISAFGSDFDSNTARGQGTARPDEKQTTARGSGDADKEKERQTSAGKQKGQGGRGRRKKK
jgi:hypothetical protein